MDRGEEGMEDDPKFDASLESVNWFLTETLCDSSSCGIGTERNRLGLINMS